MRIKLIEYFDDKFGVYMNKLAEESVRCGSCGFWAADGKSRQGRRSGICCGGGLDDMCVSEMDWCVDYKKTNGGLVC